MSNFSKIATTVRNPKFSTGAICAATIAVIMMANLILYVLGTTFGWYLYSPQEIDTSLSGSMDAQFDAAALGVKNGTRGKVKISFCMVKEDLAKHERGALVYETAKKLEERFPDLIELDYINIITKRNKNNDPVNLDKYKLNPDGTANAIYKTSVIFECEDRYKVINDYASSEGYSTFYTLTSDLSVTSYNGEEILSSMILWVMRENHPTAYFTTGHGETSSSALTTAFACAGYNLATLNVRDKGIPMDNPGNVLVISNPMNDFEKGTPGIQAEIERLEDYVSKGGNIYVALDPYVDTKQLMNLTDFLAEYGIEISSSDNANGVTLNNIVRDPDNAITTDGYTIVTGFADGSAVDSIRSKVTSHGTGKVLVREAAAINCSGDAYPILTASPSSVCEVGGQITDDAGGFCVAAAARVNGSGTRSASIFVISSVYLSSDDVMVAEGYSNKDFIYAIADELFGAEEPPYGCDGIFYNVQQLEGLTMGTAKTYTVIACIIPALIAIAGAVIITKRKNR